MVDMTQVMADYHERQAERDAGDLAVLERGDDHPVIAAHVG